MFPFLGFVIPGFFASLAILRFAEGRTWPRSIGYSAGLLAAIVLLFGSALNVQFPDGPAEQFLASMGVI